MNLNRGMATWVGAVPGANALVVRPNPNDPDGGRASTRTARA